MWRKAGGGKPCLGTLGSAFFFDGRADDDWVARQFEIEANPRSEQKRGEHLRVYGGVGIPELELVPDADFVENVSLSLQEPEHLEYFHQQGMPGCVKPNTEGFEIRTHDVKKYSHEGFEYSQGYLWTSEFFRGDLFMEFDFKPLKDHGLSLLCLQAAGMQGEDFMADYPLRSDGAMRLVWGSNVRMYHWEYFREYQDSFGRGNSSGLFKQPWKLPLGLQFFPAYLEKGVWHRLQFLQDGARLRGSIDGKQMFDSYDNPDVTAGPVLRCGRIGFRSMAKTHMIMANLRIATRRTVEFQEVKGRPEADFPGWELSR